LFYWFYRHLDINIFQYISVRAGISFFIAFLLTMFLLPKFIRWAKSKKASQPIYEHAPESHQEKAGTPTMGGIVFVFATIIATVLTAKLNNFYIVGGLLSIALFSLIGIQDDYSKISNDKNDAGLSAKAKLFLQFFSALIVVAVIYFYDHTTSLHTPFLKLPVFDMGMFSMVFWMLVIVASKYVKEILEICDEDIKIATISGRYYTMDRDSRWDRVQKGHDAISFANPKTSKSVLEYISDSYKEDVYDEFLLPCAFNDYSGVKENDAIIFCNFRSDRMREISSAFADTNFSHFSRFTEKLNIATMTQYDKNLPLPILFPKETPKNSLAEVISNAGLNQLHTAETEKYAHVTFFFNGGVEEPLLNESRVLIPSPDVATYDLKPEMSAPEVGITVRKAMDENTDFIVVNFANGDMVGHTGDYEAGIKAVEAVDYELSLIIEKVKENDYNLVLTSDHGNCEQMRDENGNTLTNHTVGDVFCFIIANDVKEVKNGSLNNIAPTVLKLMDLEIPPQMDETLI